LLRFLDQAKNWSVAEIVNTIEIKFL